ncbi:MAG: ABC transporter ATP-binding protein [Spirochaetales bacterium]|uniref:ABC transporter ATP-binding protein n=1 Tax=Candidatus Thalassospirochaeta sargassi TaxID=3119039 RepID=A0AAJ1IE83_9SPIO|nr:ABC transporter ATP-binding protein [Spirochaetales bacterium]
MSDRVNDSKNSGASRGAGSTGGTVLKIENLHVSFGEGETRARAVRGIDLEIHRGELHALVGESGSGKTVTSTCVLGLLPTPPAIIEAGSIYYKGHDHEGDLLQFSEDKRRRTRGREIAMVFQEPGKYLNPALRVGEQIMEMLRLHLGFRGEAAEQRALEILETVGLGGNRRVLRSFPHELSGGMKQRVMIAIAICCNPSLLIADEPTTALDVTLQMQILKLIMQLRHKFDMGILFISHDLAVVHDIADRVSVIYAGKIVESGSRDEIFNSPQHPYTRLLLASVPDAAKRGKKLVTISGKVPDAEHFPTGCAFHPRCPLAEKRCADEQPPAEKLDGSRSASCFCLGKEWPA